jgi:predicted peptidase
MIKIISFFTLLISIHFSQAQDYSAYKKKLFIRRGDTLRYRILYPENYKKEKPYPLVVFLHGAGDRGNDNDRQLVNGADLFLRDSIRKKFPAIVIFPQCPTDSFWCRFTIRMDTATAEAWNNSLNTSHLCTPERLVKLLMDSLAENKIADKRRIYLGGLSLGGFGTYDLVIHYPTYFAAAFPICGQANVKLYPQKAAQVPIWIFHCEIDNVISVQPDRDLYKALQRIGIRKAKYTEYPGVYHNSWVNAFAEPGLLPWLFSYRLSD